MAWDRSASAVRWAVLVLGCLSMFGSYYVYDNPTALKKQFQQPHFNKNGTDVGGLGLNGEQYNLLYSVYSFPNMILPFFGGFFVDRLGTRVTLFTFLCLICVGQLVFALGASLRKFYLMLVGRMIFGFGGESLSVAQSALLAIWFRGKEMAFAMGLNLSVARLGSVVNDQASPAIYTAKGNSIPAALWLGFFICCFSLGCTILLIIVDKWAENRAAQRERDALLDESELDDDDDSAFHVEVRDVTRLASADSPGPSEPEPEPEQMNLGDVRYFCKSYWLLCASCVIVYAAVLPFNNIAGSIFQTDKYNYDLDSANRLLAIPFLISACASPFLGRLIDAIGKRVYFLTTSAFCLMCAHLMLGFTDVTPILPLVIIGSAYSVYAAAVWPSVSFVVEEHQLGTAYGVITAIQNAGLACTPLVVGYIEPETLPPPEVTHFGSYKYVELLLAAVAGLGFVLGIWLHIEDAANGGVLNKAHDDKPTKMIMDEESRDDPEFQAKYGPFTPQSTYGTPRDLPPPQLGNENGGYQQLMD